MVFSFHFSKAQLLDSLLKVDYKTLNDTQLINYYNDISYEYSIINPDSGKYFAQKSISLAKNQSDIKYTFDSYNMLATSCLNAGENKKAEEIYSNLQKSEKEIFLKYPRRIASMYANFGNVYYMQNKFDKVIECYNKSIAIIEKINDPKYSLMLYLNLSGIYLKIGLYEKANTSILKAIEINKKLNDKEQEVALLINLGNVFEAKNDPQKAIEKFLEAKKICEIKFPDSDYAGITLFQLASAYKKLQQYKLALNHYHQALAIFEKFKNSDKIVSCLSNMSQTYLEINDLENAKKLNDRAINISKEIMNRETLSHSLVIKAQIEIAQKNYQNAINNAISATSYLTELGLIEEKLNTFTVLSEAYFLNKDYKNAYLYKDSTDLIKEELFNKQTADNIANLQVIYNLDKKEKEIKILEQQNQLSSLEISKQRNFLFLGGGILILVVGMLFLVYRNNKIVNQKNNLLTAQKHEIEEKNEELQTSNELISEQKNVIEEKQKEIIDSINYALRIQRAILPSAKQIKEYLPDSFIFYKPKDIVAGDFYWMEKIDQLTFFAVADCTGHGVPGALVSVICNNALNRSVREFNLKMPGEILNKTRELVIQEFEKSEEEVKDGMDISLCVLNRDTQLLYWAGANNPVWICSNNELNEIKADKQPVGKHSLNNPFTTHQINVLKGDVVYLSSDGYPDQFGGPEGKKFKVANLRNTLKSIYQLNTTEQHHTLEKIFSDWTGDFEQIDDVCVMGVRI